MTYLVALRTVVILLLIFFFCGSAQANLTKQEVHYLVSARLGDLDKVRKYLNEGGNIDVQDKSGATALLHALGAREPEVAKYLIEQGADLTVFTAQTPTERTVWNFAAYAGDPEIIKMLAQRNVSRKRREKIVEDPLATAIRFNRVEAFKAFLEVGFTADDYWGPFGDPLAAAARFESLEMAQWLCKNKFPYCDTTAALVVAAAWADADFLQLLIDHGADVNGSYDKSPKGFSWDWEWSPVEAAVLNGRLYNLKFLLNAGAKAASPGNRAAYLADFLGHQQMHDLLVAQGAAKPQLGEFIKALDLQLPISRDQSKENPGVYQTELYLSSLDYSGSTPLPVKVEYNAMVAVAIEDKALEKYELMLLEKLSSVAGVKLVERSDMKKIAAERNFGFGDYKELGKLTGAEILVFLDQSSLGEESALTMRVVSASSGIVLGASAVTESKIEIEAWAKKTTHRVCHALDQLDQAKGNVKLVAIPHMRSTVSSTFSRMVEENVRLRLNRILANHPGVFVVEREKVEQLLVENAMRGEDSKLSLSGVIVEGNMEFDLDQAQPNKPIKLNMSLRFSSEQEKRKHTVTSSDGSVEELSQLVAKQIISSFGIPEGNFKPFDADKEAAIFAAQAQWNFDQGFWHESVVAAKAALALGANEGEMLHLQIRAQTERLQAAHTLYQIRAKEYHNVFTSRLLNRLSYLEPTEPGGWSLNPAQMVVEAMMLTDNLNRILSQMEFAAISDKNILDLNFLTPALEAASIPLVFMNTLSAQQQYSLEFLELRKRLLDLCEGYLQLTAQNDFQGDKRKSEALYHVQLLYLAYWYTDDDLRLQAFLDLMDKVNVLPPPSSGHDAIAWLYDTQRGWMLHLAMKSEGQPRAAYIRLGRQLLQHDSPDLRAIGHSIVFTSCEKGNSAKREFHYESFLKLSSQLDTEDLMNIALNWREEAMKAMDISGGSFNGSYHYSYLSGDRHWSGKSSIDGGQFLFYPKLRRYQIDAAHDRLQNIIQNNRGGFPTRFGWRPIDDAELKKLDSLVQLYAQATALLKAKANEDRGFKYLFDLMEDDWQAQQKYVRKAQKNSHGVSEEVVTLSGFQVPKHSDTASRPFELIIRRQDPFSLNEAFLLAPDDLLQVGPGGKVVERIRTPDYFIKGVGMVSRKDYLAFTATRAVPGKEDQRRIPQQDGVSVYDRKSRQWTFYEMPVDEGVRCFVSLTIASGYLVCVFNTSPEEQGEKWKGVLSVNLKTGNRKLVASSRRKLAGNPIDEKLATTKWPLVNYAGDVAKILNYYFDPTNEQWFEDRNAAKRKDINIIPPKKVPEPTREYNDAVWKILMHVIRYEKPIIAFSRFQANENGKVVRQDMDANLIFKLDARVSELTENESKTYKFMKEKGLSGAFQAQFLGDGMIVFYKLGYFWMPKEQLEQLFDSTKPIKKVTLK